MSTVTRTTDDLRALAAVAEARFAARRRQHVRGEGRGLGRWRSPGPMRSFGDTLVVASSMGDEVLVHLASVDAPGVDLLFLDTGYHFPETIGTRDAVAAVYDVNVRTVLPLLTDRRSRTRRARQADLWSRPIPTQCCATPQGRAPRARTRAVRRVGHGHAPRGRADAFKDIEVVGWDAQAATR